MDKKTSRYLHAGILPLVGGALVSCFMWALQQAVIDEFHIKGAHSFASRESIRLALYQHHHGAHMSVDEDALRNTIAQVAPDARIIDIKKNWLTRELHISLLQQKPTVQSKQLVDLCKPYQATPNYHKPLADILYAYQIPLTSYQINCVGGIRAKGGHITIELGYVEDDTQANLILLQHLLNQFQHKLTNIQSIDMRYDHGVAIQWAESI